MAKQVLIESLAVGRCFALDAPRPELEEEEKSLRRGQPILAAKDAWKVVDELVAENAAGERRTFDPGTKVVEIPRQGFEKLAGR